MNKATQLLRHMKDMTVAYGKSPIRGWLAGGDFNTNHDGQIPECHVVSLLTKGGFTNTWLNVPKANRLTWRTEPGGRFEPTTFDYIFAKGFGDLTASTVEQSMEVSDHVAGAVVVACELMVAADLEFIFGVVLNLEF